MRETEITKPCAYAVLRRVILSLNKSAHQARSDFHVLGGACSHASLQKLHVHDCLLLFCCKNLTSARDFAHHPGSILSAGIDVFEEDLSRRGQTS